MVQTIDRIRAHSELRAGVEDGRIRIGRGRVTTEADSRWGARPTGVEAIDRTLPGGGLRAGATHEWFGTTFDPQGESGDAGARRGGAGGLWVPPLSVATAIAGRAHKEKESGGGLVLFVGRRCWPMPRAIGPLAQRAIFLDPDCDAARFWVVDQALRCPGVGAVVADATRLDMAGSRRLQLAAECGGATAFLLRPPWERPVISASETRWSVMPEAPSRADERRPRWRLELLRCKGASLSAHGTWVVELVQEAGREALRVPPDVVGGSGETAAAQGAGRSRIA
jgi:protein ImuA